jgi:hypothetical protein
LDRFQFQAGALCTTIFLIPTFFQRLFIGGEETATYRDFGALDLVVIGYLVHVIIVGSFFAGHVPKTTARFIFVRFAPLLFISIFHVISLQYNYELGTNNATLAIGRQLLWVLSCLVMVHFTSSELLLTRLVQFTHFTFAIIVLTYASYLLTSVPMQLILRDGVPRAQGLLTEPSAVGCLLAGYSALAVYKRKWGRLFLAAIVTLMVNSVIANMGFLVGMVSAVIHLLVGSTWLRRTYIIGLLLLVPAGLALVPAFSYEISAAANKAMQVFQGSSFSNSQLYTHFIYRILDAASLLETGVNLVREGSNDVEGGLFRLVSVLLLLEQLQQSSYLYFGYGLGAHAQLLEAADQSLLDFGLFPFLISSINFSSAIATLRVLPAPFGSLIVPRTASSPFLLFCSLIARLIVPSNLEYECFLTSSTASSILYVFPDSKRYAHASGLSASIDAQSHLTDLRILVSL